jgi:hypothetical protein
MAAIQVRMVVIQDMAAIQARMVVVIQVLMAAIQARMEPL